MKKIIITGSAGFIGSEVCIKLLERGDIIIGIDNHNDYYDPKIKEFRLQRLEKYPKYQHHRIDIRDQNSLTKIFKDQLLISKNMKDFIKMEYLLI